MKNMEKRRTKRGGISKDLGESMKELREFGEAKKELKQASKELKEFEKKHKNQKKVDFEQNKEKKNDKKMLIAFSCWRTHRQSTLHSQMKTHRIKSQPRCALSKSQNRSDKTSKKLGQ